MKRGQDGVALVLVLWVITLLAVIAGNFAYSMRGEAQIARNLLSSAQAKMRADGGARLAWFQLMKPLADPQRWQADGLIHEMAFEGALVRVSIHDESGKIDLNTASGELLKSLFKTAGLTDQASAALTDAVLDWRSPGDLKRLNGAKEEDYRAAGKNYGPSNAPFDTVDELQRVLGMTRELYRLVAPAVTIHSWQPGVNTAVASRQVLLAIPGVNPAMVEQFLLRRQEALATGQPVPSLAGAEAYSSISKGLSAYSVRSEARLADGTAFVRQSTVRLASDPRQAPSVLVWREGETGPSTSNANNGKELSYQ